MRFRTFLLCALMACSAATPASAQRDRAFEPNWVMPAQGRGEERPQRQRRELREVLNELRARHGGEYVNHHVEEGPRAIYVIRWRMPDGSYRDFRVPAER